MLRSCNRLFNKNLVDTFKISQYVSKNFTIIQNKSPSFTVALLLKRDSQYYPSRFKKKQAKMETETDEIEEDEDLLDMVQDKNTKILKINVTSLRVDAILKSSLGMARNKIETIFYESKIRVNGEKILKKSATIQEGDEIDVIKGPDLKNPNFTNVARVEVLSITPKEESICVKVRRCKSLTVDNY